MTKRLSLAACHECDMLHRVNLDYQGGPVECRRCGAVLLQHKAHSMENSLAFSLTGLVLFILANAFPIMSFRFEGQVTETILFTGVYDLFSQGYWPLGMVVFFTTIAIPLAQLLSLLYVLTPLYLGWVPWKMTLVLRMVFMLEPWSMMEVFMLGILVAVVKLTAMATIIPGMALWCFVILIFILAAIVNSLDHELIWEKYEALA